MSFADIVVLFYWAMFVVMTHPVWLLTLQVNFFLSVVMLSPSHLSERSVMLSSILSLVLLTNAYWFFFIVLSFCCCCCYFSLPLCAFYLLGISLSEGQLGRHMEHDLLLSVYGVDRLRTCLAMWHIQTSSKPAQGWRQQCTNPPDLKIPKHQRP